MEKFLFPKRGRQSLFSKYTFVNIYDFVNKSLEKWAQQRKKRKQFPQLYKEFIAS